jgi:hypothetical protein
MAENKKTFEELLAQVDKLQESHDNHVKSTSEELEGLKTQLANAPKSEIKIETKKPFEGKAAENLDQSGKPENEFHFTVDKKNYRFVSKHVTPPATDTNPTPGRITAAQAVTDKDMLKSLVEKGSGQIKEVK